MTFAMHIAEGFLPLGWAAFWWVLCIPFLFMGMRSINKSFQNDPKLKILLALTGAFIFVLSALKMPSVTGSCSHPTGAGLCAILFGPTATAVMGFIVLIFQSMLLAHGGITTLGANTISMGVAGPLAAYVIFRLISNRKGAQSIAVFLGAALGDLVTYTVTAIQLALAFPDPTGGIAVAMLKFMSIFSLTQIPLAVSEGILTLIVFNLLTSYSSSELQELGVLLERGRIDD